MHILNKKTIWIPVITFGLSFAVELLANKVSFFSLTLAAVLFWTSIAIAGLLVLLEIFALLQNFINEHLTTPIKKAKQQKQKIENEQERIKQLLEYNIEGKSLDKLREYFNKLKFAKFSKEAMLPYLSQWYAQVSGSHTEILVMEERDATKELQERKEYLIQDIRDLEEEKRKLQLTKQEESESEKSQFLKENEDQLFHYSESLSEEEKTWLLDDGYKKDHQWDPLYKETKEVFVKQRSNESLSHAYLTGFLYKYLQDELGNNGVSLYQTKLPDVVFDTSGFKWAIEIETGSQYRKNKKELKEKVKLNNKKFNGTWFFVVTNKNMVSKYRQFHDTVDRNTVLDKIEEIIYPEGRADIDLD